MPTISAAKMAMSHVKNVVFGGRSILSSSALHSGQCVAMRRPSLNSALGRIGFPQCGIVEGLGAMKQSNSKRLVLNQIKFNNVF